MAKKKQRHCETTAAKITTAERRADAINLRKQGCTLEQIGEIYQVSRSTVYKWIRHYLDELNAKSCERADELRSRELATLEVMQEKYWEAELAGDPDAFDRLLKIMDKRARYAGLYAPTKAEVSANITAGRFMPADELEAAIRQRLLEKPYVPSPETNGEHDELSE